MKKAGRKPIPEQRKCVSKTISLTAEEWAWLEEIDPDGKPTRAAARLIRKARNVHGESVAENKI